MAVTFLSERLHGSDRDVKTDKVTATWTSDASGAASGTINLQGFLLKVITDPGSPAPTDNYDITLVADGIDMADGLLLNRDTANVEMVYPVGTTTAACTPIFLSGDHTFTIAAAGSVTAGVCYMYLRQR